MPFTLAEPLVELHKCMFPHSIIAKEMHIKRTKFNDTMKMLGRPRAVNEDLASKLRVTKFSIIIDETTDISSMKCLAVLGKYFDSVTNSIHVRLLGCFTYLST